MRTTSIAMCISWAAALVGCASTTDRPIPPYVFDGTCNRTDFDEPPKLIRGSRPEYPADLRRSGQQGTAVVRYTVSPEGKTENIQAKSPDSRLFQQMAIAAVSAWQFQPALKDKKPVATSCHMSFVFNLE